MVKSVRAGLYVGVLTGGACAEGEGRRWALASQKMDEGLSTDSASGIHSFIRPTFSSNFFSERLNFPGNSLLRIGSD
jgi:hypothetical protein